jgi:hypothetical protein
MSAECEKCGAYWEPDHDCPVDRLERLARDARVLLMVATAGGGLEPLEYERRIMRWLNDCDDALPAPTTAEGES